MEAFRNILLSEKMIKTRMIGFGLLALGVAAIVIFNSWHRRNPRKSLERILDPYFEVMDFTNISGAGSLGVGGRFSCQIGSDANPNGAEVPLRLGLVNVDDPTEKAQIIREVTASFQSESQIPGESAKAFVGQLVNSGYFIKLMLVDDRVYVLIDGL